MRSKLFLSVLLVGSFVGTQAHAQRTAIACALPPPANEIDVNRLKVDIGSSKVCIASKPTRLSHAKHLTRPWKFEDTR